MRLMKQHGKLNSQSSNIYNINQYAIRNKNVKNKYQRKAITMMEIINARIKPKINFISVINNVLSVIHIVI